MNQSSRIVFFGNERLSTGFEPNGAPTLQSLIDNGYKVVAVVASYHQATSRKQRALEVQQVAEKYNIPVMLPDRLVDISEKLAELKPDLGVLVAFGKLVPQSMINIFPRGIVNIHPSLLPKYRGSTPIEQVILDGSNETGVSLMQLAKDMDAGPVFDQIRVKLASHERKSELTHALLQAGSKMLIKNLPKILDGTLKPAPQDESQATFCKTLSKEDGKINQSNTAQQLERQVRAYAGWPKSQILLHGQSLVITDCRVAKDANDGSLVIPCGSGTFLEITQLIAPSGRKITGADFLNGYKK